GEVYPLHGICDSRQATECPRSASLTPSLATDQAPRFVERLEDDARLRLAHVEVPHGKLPTKPFGEVFSQPRLPRSVRPDHSDQRCPTAQALRRYSDPETAPETGGTNSQHTLQ